MALSLNSISRAAGLSAPRLLIYSDAGVGKTTFAAGADAPIFLCTEDGLGTLQVDAFPKLNSFGDVIEALSALYNEQHEFKTVVLDSVDHLEPLIWQQVCAEHNKNSIEDFGYGKGYVEALSQWRLLIQWLNALRNDRGMGIVLIGHAEIRRFESPEVDSFDRYQIKLHKKASDLIQESMDCVLFANYKTVVHKEDKGFGQKKSRGVSTGDRVLYTEARPAFVAKNRYSLPGELPLSWEAFSQALRQSTQPHTQTQQPQQEKGA
ncbi:ATP-binding protein [Sansalvadorimonas verongulae]|uniref:ATP-binding protein n=1 Tax=Sansalvadorimonas verongulae TaxID=2172824 RepID=UPI0012BBEC5D|nr:ATP-binding protein [Sansalvadorimonas verongulae]MTI13811.1 ATP-binding protein [Sansalvadorimonas verongulae]